ncbi:MAG TPA: V-type ATPase subunit subunit G family protein [Methanoregulaceae archaeon]|nr:V-type ATPase subunit subunit G family protein [Methanoregulaceae archaeon]
MEEDNSLLEMVRTKELELKEKEDETRKEAESIIAAAKMRHSEIIEQGQREGKSLADAYYTQGMEQIKQEMEQMKSQGKAMQEEFRQKGEARINGAANKIIESVAFQQPYAAENE